MALIGRSIEVEKFMGSNFLFATKVWVQSKNPYLGLDNYDAFEMNPLKEAISLMEKEDIRTFKLFANRIEKRSERLDLTLFDHVRQAGDDYEEDEARLMIYPDSAPNVFHRLKSRLLGDLNKSLTQQYLDKYDALKLYHFLSVVEFYLQKRHAGLAHWFLRKAERLAKKMNHHEGLDIIYTEFIRLANEGLVTDPGEYIQKRQENQKVLQQLRQLDDVLAMVIHRVKTTQTYGEFGGELMGILESTVAEFANEEVVRKSPQARLKMYQAISSILLDKRDYPTLETYCRNTYEEFEEEGLFNKSTHRTKLQMLTYLVNSLQKNGKMEEALYYARRMHAAAKAFDRLHYKDFVFFFFNAMVVSYFQLDIDQAIATLKEMEKDDSIRETPFYVLFVDLNLALGYNQKEEFRTALKYFVRAYLLDAWKSASPALTLRARMAELLVRYEVRQYEVIQARIRQFRKDYEGELKTNMFQREERLSALIDKMNETLDPHKEEELVTLAKDFLLKSTEEGSTEGELIGYDDFIRKHFRI